MSDVNKQKEKIKTIESIKLVTQAMADVATSKIKVTRASVEHNIYFFQEISKVYKMVQIVARNHRLENLRRMAFHRKEKNGKIVVILITSNGHFYGNQDADLVRYFIEQTKNIICDRIVIGTSGRNLLKVFNYPHTYQNVVFKKDAPTFEEMKGLSDSVFQYTKIYAFHTKFITLLNQQPTVKDLNGEDVGKTPKVESVSFITEPEIFKMLDFFEGQILILLFQAIFLEVDIAHLAARMIAMNQAESNAQKMLDKENRQLIRIRRAEQNMKLLENYVSMMNHHG